MKVNNLQISYSKGMFKSGADPFHHASVGGTRFRGKLVNDKGIEIPSQRDSTLTLVVYDDLQVTRKNLFINDRIYNKKTGELIIGNTENIPYKLYRIS